MRWRGVELTEVGQLRLGAFVREHGEDLVVGGEAAAVAVDLVEDGPRHGGVEPRAQQATTRVEGDRRRAQLGLHKVAEAKATLAEVVAYFDTHEGLRPVRDAAAAALARAQAVAP